MCVGPENQTEIRIRYEVRWQFLVLPTEAIADDARTDGNISKPVSERQKRLNFFHEALNEGSDKR
jgi:hypothetical protein